MPSFTSPSSSTPSFTTLPTELQLQIYHYALLTIAQTPRIHCIHASPRHPHVYISNQPVPALLHLTSTSRTLYLAHLNPTWIYGTYVNLAIDTLYLATCPEDAKIKSVISGIARGEGEKNERGNGNESEKENAKRDGFELCKQLGRDVRLHGKVRRIAVNDSFWLRPSTVTRSIVVEAWNVLVKDGVGGGLEELCIVFDSSSSSPDANATLSVNRNGEKNEESGDCETKNWGRGGNDGERGRELEFETIGWYQKNRDEFGERMVVDERARRCDEFLRAYLGVSLGEEGWMRPVIRYVIRKEV